MRTTRPVRLGERRPALLRGADLSCCEAGRRVGGVYVEMARISPASMRKTVTIVNVHEAGLLMKTFQSIRPPSSLALSKTPSSISRVNLPVKVFCWLGW